MFKKILLQIKFIAAILLAFVYALVRGRATKVPKQIRTVVIVQTAKLGDMVCTTPMFRAVKKAIPQVRLIVIGNNVNRVMVEGLSDIDEYIVYKQNFLPLLKRLRKEPIDFVAITGPNAIGVLLLFLAGVPAIAAPHVVGGYCPQETWYYGLVRKLCIVFPHRMGWYAPQEYLNLLQPIGIRTQDTTKQLAYTDAGKKYVQNLFTANGIDPTQTFVVGISPSAGNKIKCWPTDRFATVANYLGKEYHAVIVVIGGKNDVVEAQEMMSGIDPSIRVIDTCSCSIDELKALIASLHLLVSVDSGPIYIAEAFNVPTVDIIGPIDDKEHPPVGDIHRRAISPNRVKPVMHVMNARVYDPAIARQLVDDITPEMVMHEVDELMKHPLLKKLEIRN